MPVRILGRLGWISPEIGHPTASPILPPWLITRDLREVSTFLSSDLESTQNLGSIEYLVDLSDVRVPSDGSVSGFRLVVRCV